MKKIFSLCCFLTICFLFVLPAEAKTYGQILYDLGIISGSNGDIKEADEITREEMTAILVRLSETPEVDKAFQLPAQPTFSDVPANHWAYPYVELAYHKGLTSGIGNGQFGLGQKITYNQAALFFLRSLGYDGKDISFQNAAQQIGEKYGLKLDAPAGGNSNLIRGQVFELLAKTLKTKTVDGALKLSKLAYDTAKTNKFKDDAEIASVFEPDYELLDDFKVQKLPVLTEAQLSAVNADDYSAKAYKEMLVQVENTKKFYNTYLTKDSYTYSIYYPKDKMLKKDDWNFFFESSRLYLKDGQPDGDRSGISLSLSNENGTLRMNSDIQSGYGHASTRGVVNRIHEYADKVNGLTVYVFFGSEDYELYNEETQKSEPAVYKFYIAAAVDANNKVMECIASTAYGTGYGSPEMLAREQKQAEESRQAMKEQEEKEKKEKQEKERREKEMREKQF